MAFVLEDSKRYKEIPEKGQMLIYTRKEVIFESYDDLSIVSQICRDSEVLEMHLFDNEKEYRMVTTRSKRYENGVIEAIITTDENVDTYEEVVNTTKGQMKVVNMIKYEDTGMMSIDNYRLVMEE